jgi:hypothetical protein
MTGSERSGEAGHHRAQQLRQADGGGLTRDWTAATWRKSGYSGDNGGCVEWATGAELVGIRDSRDPAGPMIAVPARDWRGFVRAVVDGTLTPRPSTGS